MYSSDGLQYGADLPTIANALQLALLAVVVVILAEFALAVLLSMVSARQSRPVERVLLSTPLSIDAEVLDLVREGPVREAIALTEQPKHTEIQELVNEGPVHWQLGTSGPGTMRQRLPR
jgi:hypothetical protein